ncbi:MAG: type II toxin-antitoxin system HipA family toxin [Gammaproteobacteria bacterium]
MVRKKMHRELFAYMNGVAVGRLLKESTGQLVFQYDENWLNKNISRPISLSMPLTELPYKGAVVENFFENLLPDNEAIRQRIQKRFKSESTKSFDLLSDIGADCVGALQLLTHPLTTSIKNVEAEAIDDAEIANLLKNYLSAPLGMRPDTDFRISIAGAQEKTALLWYQNQWYLPKHSTPTSHIIKLPIGKIIHAGIDLSESVENEWLCLKILAAFSLPVNQADIVHFEDIKTLVVQRFDRIWAPSESWLMRLPQEDFCQILAVPSALKYESDGGPGIKSILDILQNAESALEDRTRFFKTAFLFWVMGAIDGHAKNFSVLIKSHGRFQLSPIYDVISAYPLAEKRELESQKLKMAMSLKSSQNHYKWQTIQLRHWYVMAQYCHFPLQKVEDIIASVFDQMDEIILNLEMNLPNNFPSHISNAIFKGMQGIKNRCR